MSPQTRTARCSCGQLQVQCSGEPDKVSVCHCTECQRRTGSPFGVAVFFPKDATTITGSSRTYERLGDSGLSLRHHFCPNCGSTVFWYPGRRPDHIAIALGSFADPTFPVPSQSVYEESRHPWVTLDLTAR